MTMFTSFTQKHVSMSCSLWMIFIASAASLPVEEIDTVSGLAHSSCKQISDWWQSQHWTGENFTLQTEPGPSPLRLWRQHNEWRLWTTGVICDLQRLASTGSTHPDCNWTTKFRSQWIGHMEPSTTSTTVTGPVEKYLQAGTEDAPVLDWPAPLRCLHDSGTGYSCLLTYLLMSAALRL